MALRRKLNEAIPRTTSNPAPSILKPRFLLTIEEVPAWYDANQFILTGYRPPSGSKLLCYQSWTYLHNESCNIYSHLIPATLSVLGQWTLQGYLSTYYPDTVWKDRCFLSFHLLTVTVCLGVSAHFHTFMNHSARVFKRWLMYDYMGIVTLILGDFVSGIYFGFYCEPPLRRMYWLMIVTLGVLTAAVLVSPRFQGPDWRTFRLFCFIGTGFSALAPIVHAAMLFGFNTLGTMGVYYYFIEGAIMIIASFFYERYIPERLWPGKFDIWGHSHTIFHVLVVMGTASHLLGLLSSFDYSYHHRSCSS